MAQNYTVNYSINVYETQAVEAINRFQQATLVLTQIRKSFGKVSTSINNITTNLSKLGAKTYSVKIETSKATDRINRLIGRVGELKRQLTSLKSMGVNLGGGQSQQKSGTSKAASSKTVYRGTTRPWKPASNIGYKVLGPTPLDVGGIGAISMLKGMGIAYGLAGIGTLVSNIVRDAVAYDNSMQTVRNILSSHDKRENFDSRFKGMEQIVRSVGIQTKYTAPQVADAAKFLAMAGFKLEDINASIRPIADIALIGDTELGETADVVTNIMTGYGIAPNKVRKAADIMTNTFTMSNTTLMEMAEAYKYSASLLSAGGIDFEESAAALGILGNAGIKGSQAGTTMRTIMANIVNPTKKQRAAWDAVGVKRTNANGQVRDLVDIFGDLASKNISVADFYRLFHKTAAQGAVSLANHVDDWNNIIKENFMSDNMSKDLAEAKKNTIQGLWAQLTSAFTENGLRAFEDTQSPIRQMLQEAIAWLTPPEDGAESAATKAFKTFAADMMDFIKDLKNATAWIIELMKKVKPVIKIWLTFQIYMWPVLTGIRVFKAALLGFHSLVKVSGWLALATGRLHSFGAALKSVNYSGKGFVGFVNWMKGAANMGINRVGSWFQSQYISGVVGREVSPKVLARYQKIYGKSAKKSTNVLNAGAQTPITGKSLLRNVGGAIGGAWAGSQIGALGGEAWEWVGGIAGSMLAPALLVAGPWGIAGAAALAIGAITCKIIQSRVEAEKAAEAAKTYASSLTMIDGVLVGNGISKTEQWLNLMYNKHLKINEAVAIRVALLKEELGLQGLGQTEKSDKNIDGMAMQKAINMFNARDSMFGSGDMAQSVVEKMWELTKDIGPKIARDQKGHWYWYDTNGHSVQIRPNDMAGGNDDQDALAAISSLYIEGFTGSYADSVKSEILNRLSYVIRHNGSLEDALAIGRDINNRFSTWEYDYDKGIEGFNYDLGEIKEWRANEISRSYAWNQGVWDALAPNFGPKADIWNIAKKYWQGIENNSLSESDVVQYLASFDNMMGAFFQGYNEKNYEVWAKALGYYDNEWQATDKASAREQAEMAIKQIDDFIGVIKKLGQPAQDATSNLVSFALQLRGLANGYIFSRENGNVPAVAAAPDGTIKSFGDMKFKYQRDNDSWIQIDSNGKQIPLTTPISNDKFQNMVASSSDKDTGKKQFYGGHDQSNYQSHYNRNSATPKQVILNINSLLDVHSINLTKAENMEAISSVKEQIVAALVEAASEGINQINHMA